jgi:hypothetical protein
VGRFPGNTVEKIAKLIFAVGPKVKGGSESSVIAPFHRRNASIPIVKIANRVYSVGESGKLSGNTERNLTKWFCFEILFLKAHEHFPLAQVWGN